MTEAEWLACTDPREMLRFLGEDASDRKRRLFAVECCKHIWHLLRGATMRQVVEAAELFAEGAIRIRRLRRVNRTAWDSEIFRAPGDTEWDEIITDLAETAAASTSEEGGEYALNVVRWVLQARGVEAGKGVFFRPGVWSDHGDWESRVGGLARADPAVAAAMADESAAQAALVRDIFGNPFRPVTLDPSWQTPNVLALAETIYEERAFERLPILADALMDAGCDDEEALSHCRSSGPHVRGCWLVDLLLGKS